MRIRNLTAIALVSILSFSNIATAAADAAKPGASMTHMKTDAGLASALEAAGVILYVRGGATSSVIGDTVVSANGQYVFHIPVTANKSGVQHLGSDIVFFNTANNLQLQLRNPVIDLKTGVVTATLPQSENKSMTIMTITNASTLKPAITKDRKAKIRKSAYVGATLSLAPGVAAAIVTILALPANSLPEVMPFGSTDVTLYSKIKS
jgi:hypothetical protein